MVISIDLTTVITVGAALSLAGGAALYAFSTYVNLRRLGALIKRVDGDPESDLPALRDGHAGRLSDAETTLQAHGKFLRAIAKALRIASTSDEHDIIDAINRAMSEGRFSGETTGQHRAIVVEALPSPATITRRPTPYRNPIPREEPDGGPTRKR